MLLFFMLSLCNLSFGQNKYVLKGNIVDENKQPLAGATIYLYPTGSGSISDINGNYIIEELNAGKYIIKTSFIGYNSTTDTIYIRKNLVFNKQLFFGALSLQDVIITDNYAEKRKKEEPLNIEIINDNYLKQNLGGSLMKSLDRLPGVSTIDIGSGQSKPVIRGLGFNRVVVVENNIKHEAQQWGTDHGLEIEQYAINNIEVIKGPSSLMYGSDAIREL